MNHAIPGLGTAMLVRRRMIILVALLGSMPVTGAAQPASQPSTDRARIDGRVVDAADHRLPGVVVTLYVSPETDDQPDVVEATTVTDEQGTFSFTGIVPGRYWCRAELPGYEPFTHSPVTVGPRDERRVHIALQVAPIRETVEIVGVAGSGETGVPTPRERFDSNVFDVFRLPTDRFQDVLPLLPSVIRDPRGRISFEGTRPSQSALLVNGTTATDPVTGEFAVELPLKAIDTVEVFTIPYSAEFGRVTGAVARVQTRAGDDHWDLEVGGLIPNPRFRDGKLAGVGSATPRVQVSGPIAKGRAWIAQGLAYRFVRSRVRDVDPSEAVDEEILEGFDTFTQLDVDVSEGHRVTTTFSHFPSEVANLQIDTLNPARATPHFESTGWNFGVHDVVTTSSNSVWETTLATRRYDVTVERQGDGRSRLTPDGLRGNYFNALDRRTFQVEAGLSALHFRPSRIGPHMIKMGAGIRHTSFDATDRSFPVDIVDAAGRVRRQIEHLGPGRIDASNASVWGYVQDQWRPRPRLSLDVGVRYDLERVTETHHVAPRVAVAFSPRGDGRTIVKGGFGLFFEQVLLHARAFSNFQHRREIDVGVDGSRSTARTFRNVVAADGLHVPRSKTWNVELDRQLGDAWMVRLNYRERRMSHQMRVVPVRDADDPTLVLSADGVGTMREFDATLRRGLPRDGELFVSFSKRRSTGELNTFDDLYGNWRDPLLLDAENGLQPFDVPNRLLAWGTIHLAGDVVVAPAVEWRSGFPYTIFDETYGVVGARNDGGRFPAFLSADVRVTKALTLMGRRVHVGVEVLNITNHSNPRDVVANRASRSFGEFRNSVPLSVRLRLRFGL